MINKLSLYQNTTFKSHAFLKDADGKPLDGSTWHVWSEIREVADDPLVAKFTLVYDQAKARFTLSLTPKQTSLIQAGQYLFDILGKSQEGDIFLLANGTLDVLATITELEV